MSLAIYSPGEVQRVDLFGGYQPLPGVYDEMYSAPGALRPHWRQVRRVDECAGAGRAQPPLGTSPAADPRERRHLQRLWRPAGTRPPLGTRRHPALGPRGGMDRAGRRTGPAGAAAESHAGRLLRPAALAGRAAACRPSWSLPIRASCAPATAFTCPIRPYLHLYAAHLARRPHGRVAACWPIARKRPAGRATPSRTGS